MRAVALVALLGASTAAASDVVIGSVPQQLRMDRARDVPAGWQGWSDRDRGVVAAMWGRVEARGAMHDAVTAEVVARKFVEANLARLAPGASSGDFVVVANRLDGGVRTVAFAQRWRGVAVVGGQLQVMIARDAIFAAMSQAQPGIEAMLAGRAGELASAPAPVGRALAWIDAEARNASTSTSTSTSTMQSRLGRVVLPIERPTWTDFVIADHIEVVSARETWDVYVTVDGIPLARFRRSRDASATLAFDVPVQRPTDERVSTPARELAIVVDGVPTITDENGAFTFTGAGVVQVKPEGPKVKVVDAAGAPIDTTVQATDGATTTLSFATDELADAQLAAFAFVTHGKARARVIVPSIGGWLDQALTVTVNESGGECNASAAGDGLHFFKSSPTCENTARIADIVYHELGHAVHAKSVIMGAGSTASSALDEGLADFFAVNITGVPSLGRGYAFDERAVRELDPLGDERVAPDDQVPEPHQSGLIIGGALWDLRKALIAAHGEGPGIAAAEKIYAGLLMRAPNMQSTYMPALIADDDDGDLANGTPNKCAIDRAFARHGLAPTDIGITTVGAPIVQGTTISIPVRVPDTMCTPPQVISMRVVVDGQIESALTRDATGNLWGGTIPASTTGQTRYQVIAELDDGETVVLPNNRADRMYTLYTPVTEKIWCETFDADPMWEQAQLGTPALWQWGMPRGAAGDPTEAFSGSSVLGTVLDGDGRYASVGETQVSTPEIDVAGYRNVRLQFRRWLTMEDGQYDQATLLVNAAPIWTNTASPDGSVDHVDREWRFVDYPITDDRVTVTWKIATDDSRALGGWNLDDVCLVGEPLDVEDNGCCSTQSHPSSALLGLGVLALLRRRRHVAHEVRE